MHAVGLELVNHVYSATSDLSAALPTAPRWNLLTLNVILMSMKPDNLLFFRWGDNKTKFRFNITTQRLRRRIIIKHNSYDIILQSSRTKVP